jgi:hypothetical protein
MHLVKIGNKWINLEKVVFVLEDIAGLRVVSEDDAVQIKGNEAKALAQLLDNMSTKVKVEGD